jgi:hypothetical protein
LEKLWLRRKNYKVYNVLTTALIWSIWKTRNNLCFQGVVWAKVEVMFYMCAKLIRKWMLLCKQEDAEKLKIWAVMLKRRSARPPRLTWTQVSGSLASENERGPESGGLLFRVSPEQSVVCGSVPAVSDTLANDASK